MPRRLLCVLAVLFVAWPATAAEFVITEEAATRALVDRIFTRDGKYDLSEYSRCRFAYLMTPTVRFEGDNVLIRAYFSGQAGADVGGDCVGPKDAFWVAVRGTPTVEGTHISLSNLEIIESPGSLYRVVLENTLSRVVGPALRYDVEKTLREALKKPNGPYQVRIENLTIGTLVARDNILSANLDFRLIAELAK